MNHSADICAGIHVDTQAGVRLHVDLAQYRASNWVDVRGWVAGVARGLPSIAANLDDAYFTLSERPDVCTALSMKKGMAYGFAVQFLARGPFNGQLIEADLLMDGLGLGRITFVAPAVDLPRLPFATQQAVSLTRELFRDPQTGNRVNVCDDIVFLPGGAIAPKHSVPGFDNTRIGNYHPDVPGILARPGTIGLDVGCGIRDVVFDNLVTQDIYPTPTATLVTRPEQMRLPFSDGIFDLLVLDSVLEHVPDPFAFLLEARRVLKTGGVIVGDVPFLQPLHLAPHHYFNFTPYGLAETARKASLALEYVAAENHQRPEFSLEWLLRRTFESVSSEEVARLRALSLGQFFDEISCNKNLIGYPPEALEELAAGYHFRMVKD